MIKTLTGVAMAATLAIASVAVPQKAEARCWGCWAGAGFAAGAIIGAAAARPYYYGPGYYYGPAYYRPACWWHREWTPYGWRRVRVCR